MSRKMGTFRVPIELGSLAGGPFDRAEALVDTGASHTSWPRDRLARLGIEPEARHPFELADGREVLYDMAWARVRIARRSQPTVVVFAEPESEPLLGAVTLEEFLLAPDPVARRLIPIPGLLKTRAGVP